jgi:hypothetical protein
VEPRQHYAVEFVVKNALHHLPAGWGVHVVHGKTNGKYVRHVLADMANVRFSEIPVGVMRIFDYNNLLKSKDFWLALNAENVLIVQTDSVILNGNINDFIGYDYIGAPWHTENERWSKMTDILPGGVGNGGFSLRTTTAALAIIERYGNITNGFEHEDIFFAKHMTAMGFKLGTRTAAYNFCVEVPCSDMPYPAGAPFALHAGWYYVPDTALLHEWLEKAFRPQ